MNIYNFTKNTLNIKIVLYEIQYRWKTIIKPGLNEENKNYIKYLIQALLNCSILRNYEKRKLSKYINELNND